MNTNRGHAQYIPRLAPATGKQLDMLHAASLEILQDVGINVHSEAVRGLLIGAGAKAKGELGILMPPELVERALSTAPPRIDVYDRKGKRAMVLEGTRCYYGTGSDLKHTIDSETGSRRPSTMRDVEVSSRLCDRLANIDFVMSYGLPAPGPDVEVEQFRTMLAATGKPLVMTSYSGPDALEGMHELACASCGGPDKFRQAPNYVMYGQFVSPLQHDPGALDRLAFCADRGIPLIYVPTITMGASGPVTLAGALALANAECLGGLVMHQLRFPGAPFIYGGCVSPLDMKTMVFSYGSPEWRLADAILSQLSLRYELPVFATAGATDSSAVDAQAGAEWAYSLMISALSGANLIHDVGYLESGLTGSLEALVISDEIVGMVKAVCGGFKISDRTLAMDTIKGVGPGGHFLAEDHTLERFREIWYPRVFTRDRLEQRQPDIAGDLLSRAKARAAELLKG